MISKFGIDEGNCSCICTDEALCRGDEPAPILFTFFSLPDDLSNKADWDGFKTNETRVWGVFLMVFCLLMAIIGVGWIIKVQFVLLALILLSMVSVIVGAFLGPGFKRGWGFMA